MKKTCSDLLYLLYYLHTYENSIEIDWYRNKQQIMKNVKNFRFNTENYEELQYLPFLKIYSNINRNFAYIIYIIYIIYNWHKSIKI